MDELIGKKLEGRYLLESLVGVGGMANVYKGKDLKTDTVVAVKILREEFSQNTELVRRFKNESKAISILDHPNIVKVYDVSVTDRLQFIVMEYIDGITLKEYMNRRGGPLTWKEVVHFCQQILDALDHAHQKGVVHRDIKPQNIMLLADGRVKIMDFGIARFSRAEYQDTSEKAIGSVHYISPEQAKGDVTDAKADIYSMGVMMYEMLSGKLPFESNSAVSVAIKQIADTAVPLGEVAPDVPKALQDITARAMAKDPARRYPSARAMLNDLEEFKKNPSIRFEYEYLTEDSPERYIDKVVKQTNPGPSGRRAPARGGRKPAGAPANKDSRQPAKPRRKRRVGVLPILAGMATAFALGSAILCTLIFANSTNPLFSSKEDVELPDFTGMQWETVKAEYSGQLTLVAEQEYSDKYEAGVIYYQSPRGPRTVKEGQKVTVKVSLGTLYVNVPDVSQWKIADAEQELKDLGLQVRRMIVEDDTLAEGTVIRTEPAAGESIASGETVSVYVSQKKIDTETTVPPVKGISLEDAQKALTNNNLVVGVVTEAYSSDYAAGVVIDSAPVEGATVKVYSQVGLVVSMGPEPTPEPTPEPPPEPTPVPTPSPVPTPILPTPAPATPVPPTAVPPTAVPPATTPDNGAAAGGAQNGQPAAGTT